MGAGFPTAADSRKRPGMGKGKRLTTERNKTVETPPAPQATQTSQTTSRALSFAMVYSVFVSNKIGYLVLFSAI